MNINNIKDVVYSITTNSNKHQEVGFKFIYNNYVEEETQIKDDVILNRVSSSKNKFIRIDFENSTRDESTNYIYHEFKINVLHSLENKDLYLVERELFNKLDNLTPNRMSLINDIKRDEFNKFINLYSSELGLLDEIDFASYDNSSAISFKSDLDVIESVNNKDFVETFNYNNMLSYNSLVNSEKIENERKSKERSIEKFKTGELLPNLNYISSSINEGNAQTYADSNNVFCGIYVEKFKLNEESNEFEFLCSRFYTARQDSKANDLVIPEIEDEAINYGKTYRYVCYNTYLYTTVHPDDRFVLRHYLLCTYPYISNNIVCKESDIPPAPVGLTASFNNKENFLMLEWSDPNDYEGDIKGYQVFRRDSVEEPYKLIKQLEGHQKNDFYEFKENVLRQNILKTPGKINKRYIDENFNKNKMSIYTVRAIDAHGMTSNYGDQIGIYYDLLRDETLVSLVGYSGANVNYPNETLLNKSIFHENNVDLIDNLPIVKKPNKISLYVTPDYARISLNGNEQNVIDKDYQFTFINLNDFIYKTDKFSIVNFG